jgi:hypothetical protein
MISDERIKKAAEEYEEILLSSLPVEEEHFFSEKFETKMQKINRRTERKPLLNVWKRVAVIVLVSALFLGLLVMTNASVRASMVNWINWQYAAGSGHLPNGVTPPESPAAFELTWIPSGCSFVEKILFSNGHRLLYKDACNKALTFQYFTKDMDNYTFNQEGYTKKDATVFGLPAAVYLSAYSANPNVVVWKSHDDNVLFVISAYCDEQTLLKIAESIRPTE